MPLKLTLNDYWSPTLPGGPASSEMPEDPRDCWVIVQAAVEGGGQNWVLTFYVTTPLHLAKILERHPHVTCGSLMVLPVFSWSGFESALADLLERCGAREDAREAIAKFEF